MNKVFVTVVAFIAFHDKSEWKFLRNVILMLRMLLFIKDGFKKFKNAFTSVSLS